jgi:hypothetical protein
MSFGGLDGCFGCHVAAAPATIPHRCHMQDAIEDAVRDCLVKGGGGRHILNLGHGVLVGTPEEVRTVRRLLRAAQWHGLEAAGHAWGGGGGRALGAESVLLPMQGVAHMFDLSKRLTYKDLGVTR